ncbi:MAG: hypothetical protein RI985_915 [Chloroflexota bacterium]|jgi:hypothetical protein
MFRGLVTGFVMALLVGIWARRQPAVAFAPCHRVTPNPEVIERATAQTHALLNTIERESPWILKPNAKPSNSLSVQS